MFQGSESLEKLAHFRHVQSSGGTFNGSTHPDYTDYFEVLPSAGAGAGAVPRGRPDARAEADRGEPAQPDRRGQGGDPAQRAQPARTAGSRGSCCRRCCTRRSPTPTTATATSPSWSRPTWTTARQFFDTYYAPGQRGADGGGRLRRSTSARDLIEKHFGDVPARPAPRPAVVRRAAARTGELRVRAHRPARAAARARGRLPHAGPDRRAGRLPGAPGAGAPCSPRATGRGCSSAWCTASRWSPTSTRRAACSARSRPATRTRSRHRHVLARGLRRTACSAAGRGAGEARRHRRRPSRSWRR